jgi:hypothetical protein
MSTSALHRYCNGTGGEVPVGGGQGSAEVLAEFVEQLVVSASDAHAHLLGVDQLQAQEGTHARRP